MEISLNNGEPKHLEDFHAQSWTNVDLTELVDFNRTNNPLNDEQYRGIGENVFNISITPLPNEPTRKKREMDRKSTDHEESSKKAMGTKTGNGESDIDVYALLIVKRSPFLRTAGQ